MKRLSIIIPAYNEAKTLPEILRRVKSVTIPGWNTEIVVVNDASTDATRTILDAHDGIVVIHHDENKGKGSAVATGLARATGDYILIQDADLEYSPSEIPILISGLGEGISMVYGSRNLHHEPRSGFLVQRAGVWLITKLINILYGARLTDVWTCYKLFPSGVKNLFNSGRFESELVFTVRALRGGHSIAEAPISHTPRDASEGKKIRYRDGVYAIFLILADRLLHLRGSSDRKA
jgi:glycosyltransferase involved in cell wall biosynthesis